jgi:uncharacterized membrane protein YjjB (DUF3815 family)
MFKKKYFIVLFIIITSSILQAQPYYYTSTYEPIEGHSKSMGDIYRVNMNNPAIVETLLTDIYELASEISDEYGNWIAFEDNFRLTIMSINNPLHKNIIANHSEGVIKFSYSNAVNRLVIRYYGEYPNPEKMVLVEPASLTITDTIPYTISEEILTDKHANFSKNGDIMYVQSGDSVLHKPTIISYSLSSKQIIKTKYIDDITLPGSEKAYFYFRQNSLATIESYYNMNDPYNYYRIYFLDKDSLSIQIKYLNPADAYVSSDGKFLVILQAFLGNDSTLSKPTGKIDIYNMTDGALKKTIQLPPDGEVMYFENYPNNVYYVKDIELPTRLVWNLNMDSIFNVLDLTNLNPNTINIGANSFTLTVNGKGFDTLSTIYFNGQEKVTTFLSDSVLIAEIITSDVSVTGSFPVWVKDRYSISDTLQFIVTQENNPNLVVSLKNSTGTLLTNGSLQYYDSSWKDVVSNGDGTFTVVTNLNAVSLRMTYEYGSQTVSNINAHNNTYTFQTVNAQVQLKNSMGEWMPAPMGNDGMVQYYSGAWRDFGTTSNGVATKELLPNNYSFRMTYAYGSKDKQQDLSTNPTVVFQTVAANVQLKNSMDAWLDGGMVQYYSGAWREFGTTTNGVAVKELLPNNYSFRMTYAFASKDKQEDISTNSTVVFQTVAANVQLKNSMGEWMDGGMVQYYSGAWRDFGTTTNGVAIKELLPNNYSFRMTYAYASKDKQQDLSTNSTVVFQTVAANVQLKNSLANLIDQGTVQYYSGAWRSFGTTVNGVTTKELLPNNYSFRMTYEYVSNDKAQDISTNSTVNFSTVLCTIRVKDAQSNPVNNALASYYSGAWRQIGSTVNGEVTKELLPANLTFRVKLGTAQQDKTQNLVANNVVEFSLP